MLMLAGAGPALTGIDTMLKIQAVYTGGSIDGAYCCDRVPQTFKDYMSGLGFKWVDDGPDGVIFEAIEGTPLDTLEAVRVLTDLYASEGWQSDDGRAYTGVVDLEQEEGDSE